MFRRLIPGPLLAVLAVLVAVPAPASAISERTLESRLSSQMRQAGSASSAYVMRLDGDKPVYSLRADRALIPASVNKLFVTAAALRLFGPEERLPTTVLARDEIDERGVLDGSLWLRGGGDPGLTAERIAGLAEELAGLGLRRVEGGVIGDESLFDGLRGSANTGGRVDWEIGGQLGALLISRGYAGRSWQKRPAAVAADALRTALSKAGVRVRGKARVGRAPSGAVELASTSSAPMSELITRTNVPSDNYYAEMLLKALGAYHGETGSTDAGAVVVRDDLAEIDVRPTIVDGSGLSRGDRANSRHVVTLLAAMVGDEDLGDPFLDSLAVAGRSGTLRYRMRSSTTAGRCRGKTGTLRDVSNLAGVCDTPGGRVAFSILMNGVNPSSARAIQDRMVNAIAKLR
ncbi:MAG TPA: D-alanyl-D-alanine carboxypeptidase/D-alanyl-D-alanine-endopeptidase [Capillimicrobium sp.]|nr:D-alanyl-D-alanine carboxypeptidase/D-alanyl-D-alanine-endopeptidase [Capillimicrobium sp.]